MSPCKIKKKITYFLYAMAQSKYFHSKRKEWEHRKYRDGTKERPKPIRASTKSSNSTSSIQVE
jgi:hypothetical protein